MIHSGDKSNYVLDPTDQYLLENYTLYVKPQKTKPQKLVSDVMAVISKLTDTDKFLDNTRLYIL